jgi:hypothetical protein
MIIERARIIVKHNETEKEINHGESLSRAFFAFSSAQQASCAVSDGMAQIFREIIIDGGEAFFGKTNFCFLRIARFCRFKAGAETSRGSVLQTLTSSRLIKILISFVVDAVGGGELEEKGIRPVDVKFESTGAF